MRLKSVPAGGLRLLLLPWLYVLGGAPGGVQAITLTTEPSIALQPSAPLAGLLEFSTDVPTTARFRVRSADEEWIVDSTLPKTEHAIPVLGLAPDTAYIIDQLQLRESSGPRQTMDVALETATSPLPQNFINIDVPTSIPDRMEPGFTLFEARDTRPATVFVDERGTVRWYLDGTTLIDGSLQPNGRLLGRVRNSERQSEIREYDLLGNLVAAWHPAGATGSLGSVLVEGVNVFHHDQQRLPNGNFLVLDQADLTIDSFPTSDTDRHAPTESRIVRQDVIHEFTPAGEVINSWSLIDMLDPVRIGYGVVRRPPAPQDWSHANAVVYDASDDSIIVSVRHQDAVIKFDKSTGDLKWILGTHEAWGPQFRRYLLTPVGGDDFEWPFHTHSPQILPDDPSAPFEPDDPDTLTLLIHDNGNERAIPFDPALADEENYTRAVEYRINEQDMTIEQTWAYGKDAEQVIYSPAQGDADWMPITNNVLIDFATSAFIDGERIVGRRANIVEVDRSGEVVFQLVLTDPSDEAARTVSYRAERVPSLYDGSEYVATEITGLDGDFNGDRLVDGADLIRWQRFRDPTESLSPWETGFGRVLQQESTTIPEPSSIGMLAIVLLAWQIWKAEGSLQLPHEETRNDWEKKTERSLYMRVSWLRFVALACWFVFGGVADLQAITLTTEPSIALQPNAPLAGLLEFSTDVPTTARFRVRSADEEWIVDSTLPKTEHAIPVLGLAPDNVYRIDQLQLRESGGPRDTFDVTLEAATSPLPQRFINIDVPTSIPDRMEPGFTLFEARNAHPATVFVDELGTVRWYLDGTTLFDGSLQPNGRLLGRVRTASRQSEIREYDLLGNRLAAWHAEGAISSPGSVLVEGVNIFHHDQQRLPNGNYLVLDQADVTIDNFPTSDADRHAPTESRIVRQDVIHEFTPAGEVINSWSLLEMLDPVRIGYGVVKEPPAPQDWSHSNAVVYDASDDSIIVSVRHQDAVIKFDKSTGDLKWILGTHEAWGPQFRPYLLTPIGGDDFEWPFHTHSPQILPDDPSAPHGLDDLDKLTLLIHDNGNNRAIPFDPALPDEENYTRAVEYRINEQDMTIEQTWAYGKDAEQILYSPTAGDADWMPVTNNVLIGFAGPTFIDGESQPGRNAHIVEVDRSGKVVFQLVLSHPSDESTATITYRAERVPSLYDGSEYIATEITGLDGDFNGDRFVDGADLIRWQRFRDPTESLSPWETGFGTALQQESTTEIPEPPSVGLLAVMLLGCIVRQRRRGQTGPRPYVGQRMMSTSK